MFKQETGLRWMYFIWKLKMVLYCIWITIAKTNFVQSNSACIPASILYKSIADRYRSVSYPDEPITARYRFIKTASWDRGWPAGSLFASWNFLYSLKTYVYSKKSNYKTCKLRKSGLDRKKAQSQLAFYLNLYRLVIDPTGNLSGR